MPTISGKSVLLTGTTVANVLLGSQYELAPFDGTIEIAALSDKNDTQIAIFSGPDVLQEPGGACPFSGAATGVTPKYPDDYHWEDEVAKGDRLKITFFNPNAATATILWSLRLTPA